MREANLPPDLLYKIDLLAWQHAYKHKPLTKIQVLCNIVVVLTGIAYLLTYL